MASRAGDAIAVAVVEVALCLWLVRCAWSPQKPFEIDCARGHSWRRFYKRWTVASKRQPPNISRGRW